MAGLPEWFGLPESTAEYIKCSQEIPFWADIEDDVERGFIVLKETSSDTAEIFVMGVRKAMHKNGVGKKLFQTFLSYAKKHGYSFIQVKTVQEGHYDEYDKTSRFYKKLSFKD